MVPSEEELPVEIADVYCIEVDDWQLLETGDGKAFNQFTAYTSSTDDQYIGCVQSLCQFFAVDDFEFGLFDCLRLLHGKLILW